MKNKNGVSLIDAVFRKSAKLSVAMPFRFKKSESPAKAVRRVTRERIHVARERLREGGHSEAIHDVRREIKKLRAIFRLARGERKRGKYRKSVKALRAAADYLAALRDARVMLKVFEKLTGNDARRFAEVEKELRRHCRRESRRFRENDFVAAADRILLKIERQVGRLELKASGWAAIEPGLKESYARGWKAFALARRKPLPENFHDWRKHVKTLWYYFQLLRPAWPLEMRVMMDELELLGGQLGEEHDLALLKQFAARQRAGQIHEAAALNVLIESRQTELRAAALKLGSKLYSEPPAALCRKLRVFWNLWRGR
jgi:CHAD domain-containing protein